MTEQVTDRASISDLVNKAKEMYKSPFFVVLITYAEVLPVGLAVTLVIALESKQKTRAKSVHKWWTEAFRSIFD